MWPEPITQCECEAAGWCPRHQCVKTHDWLLLCRLDQFTFDLWENGGGPCVDRIQADLAAQAKALPQPVELLPCRHRGVEPLEMVDCELCGGRQLSVPVFACGVLGKCTPRRYGSRTAEMRTMPSCLRCSHYAADAVLGGTEQESF